MANAEEFRRRRDRALKAWRQEVERFGELLKSSNSTPIAMENQKKAIGDARNLYDFLNDEYLNHIESMKVGDNKATGHLAP